MQPARNDGASRYTDWQQVGEGSSARVYRVQDRELGSVVAVKLLHPKHQGNPSLVDGMRREVLISRSLRHPNICAIHDLYEGPEGFGVVLEFVDGIELRDWMDRHANALLATAPQRLTVLRKIAEVLDIAHQKIVHRDLKPANVFLRDGDIGSPVIMDFGVSLVGKVEGDAFAGGTPKYMAPEQVAAPEQVDRRADLFAFGVMAYELMTGGRLPPCSLQDVVQTRQIPTIEICDIPPPSGYCSAVSPALDRIILQLLTFDPDLRPSSAAQVAEALSLVELAASPAFGAGSGAVGRNTARVEAGEYVIGSEADSANPAEKPMRVVRISPFEIDQTPVTNAAYRAFLDATGHARAPLLEHPIYGADDHPVVMVSANDAEAFAIWAGGRLPTEAEWEIAAKAGDQHARFPWGGGEPDPVRANVDGTNRNTTSVHAFPSGRNAWGIWDMCGNVWEWCMDGWREEFYGTFDNGALDPCHPDTGGERTIRGGSYDSFASMGRCAFRGSANRSGRRPDIGFRVVYPK